MKPIVTRHAYFKRNHPRYNVQFGPRRFVISGWRAPSKTPQGQARYRVLVYERFDDEDYRLLHVASLWCLGSPRKPGVAAILKFLAAE